MTTSYAHRDRRERAELADAIVRHRADIELRWADALAADGEESIDTAGLLSEYVPRLAGGLRAASPEEASELVPWEEIVRAHAEERVRVGLGPDAVVRDIALLRRAVLLVLDREGEERRESGGASSDAWLADALSDVLEACIEAAVTSYTRARDDDARRQRAEHLAFVTHELRSPLTTAVLASHHLSQTAGLSTEQRVMVALIERSQRRLGELIDAVLVADRDEQALQPEPVVTTLGHILEEPLAAARLTSESKGVSFNARFDADLVVHVDPKLMSAAVGDVLENAVRYADGGDIEVFADDGLAEVLVHVRNGAGIPEDELEALFEPSRRGGGRVGTGVGLAAARRAIESQGGTVHVDIGEDRACHFWLTLPKAPH